MPIVAEQQQSQQQIDQAAYAMGNLQLNNRANSFTQLAQNQQFPGSGKVVNHYTLWIVYRITSANRDLSLPPPPITISQDNIVTPSEYSNVPYQYVRSTLNAVPKTNSLLKKTKLPFAIVIRPYLHLQDSDNQVPLNTDGVIVRCRRCRSYMNPFVVSLTKGENGNVIYAVSKMMSHWV
ncbi:Sec23/Sec24 zinc finger family protein [Saccharomyces cerevisiae]|nr:Sec23/Sec24 zinc finger family protein [Saccharomyces cerevisiae]